MVYQLFITGDAEGPFDIYYNSISVGTQIDTGVTRSSLVSGYNVNVPSNALTIIVQNTGTDCSNTQTYYIPTYTPTPVPTSTPTPTPTPISSDCALIGGSVTIQAVSTPTPTPTSTPIATPTVTPTPTPTTSTVINRANVTLNALYPQSIFEISNSTVGGTIDAINVGNGQYTVYGKNDAYISTTAPTTVIYRIRKKLPSNLASDVGDVILSVNGLTIQSYHFIQNQTIDFYVTVTLNYGDVVSIEIWEG